MPHSKNKRQMDIEANYPESDEDKAQSPADEKREEPPKEKRRIGCWLWILIIVGILLAAAGLSALGYFGHQWVTSTTLPPTTTTEITITPEASSTLPTTIATEPTTTTEASTLPSVETTQIPSTTEASSTPTTIATEPTTTTVASTLPSVATTQIPSTTEAPPTLSTTIATEQTSTTEAPTLPSVETTQIPSTTEAPSTLPTTIVSEPTSTTEASTLSSVETTQIPSTTETPSTLSTTTPDLATASPIPSTPVPTIKPDCLPHHPQSYKWIKDDTVDGYGQVHLFSGSVTFSRMTSVCGRIGQEYRKENDNDEQHSLIFRTKDHETRIDDIVNANQLAIFGDIPAEQRLMWTGVIFPTEDFSQSITDSDLLASPFDQTTYKNYCDASDATTVPSALNEMWLNNKETIYVVKSYRGDKKEPCWMYMTESRLAESLGQAKDTIPRLPFLCVSKSTEQHVTGSHAVPGNFQPKRLYESGKYLVYGVKAPYEEALAECSAQKAGLVNITSDESYKEFLKVLEETEKQPSALQFRGRDPTAWMGVYHHLFNDSKKIPNDETGRSTDEARQKVDCDYGNKVFVMHRVKEKVNINAGKFYTSNGVAHSDYPTGYVVCKILE